MAAIVESVNIATNRSDGSTYCLPGILARSRNKFGPVAHLLRGIVTGFDDVGTNHNQDVWMQQVGKDLYLDLHRGQKIDLVGESMGGMKIPFLVDSLSPADRARLGKIIIVDAPTGAETMKALPNWFAPALASGLVAWGMAGRIGDALVAKMTDPPKLDEITTPDRQTAEMIMQRYGSIHTYDEWSEFVAEESIRGLSGFSGRMWQSWLAWMIQVGRDHSLEKACMSLAGLDVTYVACVHPGNSVVAQPSAANWWRTRVPGIKEHAVSATHSGFLQNQPELAAAIRKILDN